METKSETGMARVSFRELFAWVVLFSAHRLLVFATSFAELHRIDELYAGAAALELFGGHDFTLPSLAWDPYQGGSVVIILLAWAIFQLIGPTFFAIKAIALAWSAPLRLRTSGLR